MQVPVAAIVPAYNEASTIGDVVRALKSSPILTEVIVISDGSTDGTADAARAAGATLVHELPLRSGKGKAVQHGVTHTDAPILFFCDADLIGLTSDHVRRVVQPVVTGGLAMCVGLRDRGSFMTALERHLPLIGGERALHRSIFTAIPERFIQGFMLETALNYACRSRGLAYGSVVLPKLSMRRKMQKVGVWKGGKQYVGMGWEMAKSMVLVRWQRYFGHSRS